ncbi:hypothetical protein MYSE111917_14555 [Mycobacterium senriense]
MGAQHRPAERNLLALRAQRSCEQSGTRFREHFERPAPDRSIAVGRVAVSDGVENGKTGAHPAVESVSTRIGRRAERRNAQWSQRAFCSPAFAAPRPRRWRVDAHHVRRDPHDGCDNICHRCASDSLDDRPPIIESDEIKPLARFRNIDPNRHGHDTSLRTSPRRHACRGKRHRAQGQSESRVDRTLIRPCCTPDAPVRVHAGHMRKHVAARRRRTVSGASVQCVHCLNCKITTRVADGQVPPRTHH